MRSILNSEKLDKVLQFIQDNDISIACLSETWFDAQSGIFTAKIKENGFDIKHAHRDDRRGGGVAILYRDGIKMKPGEGSTTKYLSFEFIYCLIAQILNSKIILVNVYRQQEVSCEIFCEEMEKFLDSIFHKGDIMIVVGDFNIWAEMSVANTQKVMNLMNAYGLTQTIKESTHEEGHTLDHVYYNVSQIDLKLVVNDGFEISDHYPIITELPSIQNKPNNKTISYRKTKDADVEKFKNELKQELLVSFSDDNNFESNYMRYSIVAKTKLDEHFPIVTKTVVHKEKIEGMDGDFRRNRAIRRKLEKQWRKRRTDESRSLSIDQRNLCNC